MNQLKKLYHQRTKAAVIIGLGLVIIGIALLSIAGNKPKTNSQAQSVPQAVPTSTNIVAPSANAPSTAPVATPGQPQVPSSSTITGYGALQSDWDSNHIKDTRYQGNPVYNPTPGLGLDDMHDDAYYLVTTSASRITGYTIRLPNGSNLLAAKAKVMAEFPSDGTVLWQQTKDQCSQVAVTSASLGAVLGIKDIGDPTGQVLIEFQTDLKSTSSLNSYYEPSNVNLATLTIDSSNTAADAPSC
jgi:hypothetical protein